VKYIVRLNPKARNPLTGKIEAKRLWEIEQCADKDSGTVKWHCAEVRIGEKYIREFFVLPKQGDPPFEKTCYGICYRGQDNAIVIDEREHDVS
jgi:hypothetical protein